MSRNPIRFTTHLWAIVLTISNQYLCYPFAAHRTRPASTHHPQWRAMRFGDVTVIEFKRQQRFFLECLSQRNSPGYRLFVGIARQMRVSTDIGHVLSVLADAAGLQHISKSHPGPFWATDGTCGPLVATCPGSKFSTAVTATFKLQRKGCGPKILFQLRKRKRLWLLARFSMYLQRPGCRINGAWCYTVVANKQCFCGGDQIIQQVRRRFGV